MSVSASIAMLALKKPLEELYKASQDSVRRKLKIVTTEARMREIQKSIKCVQKVKTMWRIEKEVALTSFYYPSKLIIGKSPKLITSLREVSETENFVIQGTVGQGKSIFLRYLCMKELGVAQRIPIFAELRRYDPKIPFKDFLVNAVSLYRIPCDQNIFDYLAESGKLVLLLDAFDEIEQSSVTQVLTGIEFLIQRYPKIQVVITSRPDSGIEQSPLFRVYQLAPLNAEDHQPFLDRIIDEKRRVQEILEAIRKSSGEIRSLLTTPLLMTLLVIIYNSTQEIPSSLSEFYNALFYTLLTRHDKAKPGFRRKRETMLSDSELRKLFEAFCYAARQQNLLVLTDSNIGGVLDRAYKVTGIHSASDAFVHDMTKVACLMQQEGFEYHFIHKSVAEFHAASFIARTSEDNAQRFYAGMVAGKWPKWRQELEFLSQIDRLRYLKYFYVPSNLEALNLFSVDPSQTDRISDASTKAILRSIDIVPAEKANSTRISGLHFSYGIALGYVADEIVMRSLDGLLRGDKTLRSSGKYDELTQRMRLDEFLVHADIFELGKV